EWDWITRPLREDKPIAGALTAFTDAGRKSRSAAVVWQEQGEWKQHLLKAEPEDSLQTLELLAVVWAVSHLNAPLNVVSDSLYVVRVASRIEDSTIKEVANKRLFSLFLQ
ncbi:PO113 protein, partial [Sylvia borin]|nr:PO113 protein [Sylvia borin]